MILNMGDIRQESSNDGSILNFNKRLYRQSLNNTFSTNVEKSIVFKKINSDLEKINSVSFLEIKFLADNAHGDENLVLPKS